jgi:GNAT superfamily N-acetyltransferase
LRGTLIGMHIRPANADDVNAVAALHAASWRDAYADILDPAFMAGPIDQDRLAVWTERLRSPIAQQGVFIAEQDGEPIGFVCVFAGDDPQFGAKVDNLHVRPGHRGGGLGQQLLRHAARWVSENNEATGLYLWVFEANEGGRRFYARLGGQEVERADSGMPSAAQKPALRVVWPVAAVLAQSV